MFQIFFQKCFRYLCFVFFITFYESLRVEGVKSLKVERFKFVKQVFLYYICINTDI